MVYSYVASRVSVAVSLLTSTLPQQSLRPVCWTVKLREIRLRDIPRNVLNQRDIHTRYTVLHALASGKGSRNVLKEDFRFLAEYNLMGKLLAKDRDGDVPLQSAVYSRAGSDIIMLILDFYPTARVKMLENRNKCHETAIEWVLHQEDIDVFRLLLEQCIKYGALEDLTGIRKGSRCSTLLHQCIVGRHIEALRIYMQVCMKERVDIDLCPVDPNGRTPWNYLVRYKDDEIHKFDEILAILQKHNVNLRSLHANKKNQETMLHMAYRLNRPWVIDRLAATCGSATDRFKRKPQQRDRSFTTSCPQPRQQHPTQPPQVDVVHRRHAGVVQEANSPQASAAEAGVTHQQNRPETSGAHQARPARVRKRCVGVAHHQPRPAQGHMPTLEWNPPEAYQPSRPAQAHAHRVGVTHHQQNLPETGIAHPPAQTHDPVHLYQASVADQPNPPQGSTVCQRNPPCARQQLHLHQPTRPPGPQTPPHHELSHPREQPGTRLNYNQMPLHQPHHSSDDSSSDQEMVSFVSNKTGWTLSIWPVTLEKQAYV